MKKYLILVLSVVFTLNTSAQTFGLKGGVALTNLIGADVDPSVKSRTGFFLGAFIRLGEDNIQSMPEVIFHQKGVQGEGDEGEIVMNYLDIGVNGLFHINDEFALSIGPYLGYLASGTVLNKTITDWDGFNRIEFGSNLGAIYNLNDLLHLDIRYGFGFTDVLEDLSARNSSIQIGIGYVFGY